MRGLRVNKQTLLGGALLLVVASVALARPAQSAMVKLVNVTNWPKVQNTREQNLDKNGHIKVHEQGTANIKVTNEEPLRVIQEGGSGGGGSSTGKAYKTVTLFDNR